MFIKKLKLQKYVQKKKKSEFEQLFPAKKYFNWGEMTFKMYNFLHALSLSGKNLPDKSLALHHFSFFPANIKSLSGIFSSIFVCEPLLCV